MKKVRAAIVGYGNIGQYALQALEAAPDFEVAGIVRRAGAENCPEELKAYQVVKDIKELGQVDVALLCTPTRSVEAYAKELKEKIFPDFPVEYLHGKMSEKQKNETMLRFKAGEIKLLVSTTVIEVGVDVPNATMMLIENAERFGLSQLHQLRGRVGRGQYRGYCVLFSDENAGNETTAERLKAMEDTTDGFEIARRDLAIRGPGEFFGERQSGTMPLKIANLGADMRLLTDAQAAAKALLKADPTLSDYPALRERVAEMFAVEDAFH